MRGYHFRNSFHLFNVKVHSAICNHHPSNETVNPDPDGLKDFIKIQMDKVIDEQQKIKKEVRKIEKLAKEVSIIKEIVAGIREIQSESEEQVKKRIQNLLEDKHNASNQPPEPAPPATPETKQQQIFCTKETLLSEGIKKFITGQSSTYQLCLTYREWYESLVLRFEENTLHKYETHLLMKLKFEEKRNNFGWYSNEKHETFSENAITIQDTYIDTYTLDDGWNLQNTKFALILHPMDISKILELGDGDDTDEEDNDILEPNGDNTNKGDNDFILEPNGDDTDEEDNDYNGWINDEVADEYYNDNEQLLVLCIK